MMRWHERWMIGLLCLAWPLLLASEAASARQEASIVIDFDRGEVLHARDADALAYPASLTKMMTLYLTFRALEAGQLRLGSRLKVSGRAAAMPPTKLGLKPGTTIRVEDAILGLVTKSANDAAAVLAEALGGNEDRFALLMTRTARRIGMSQTVFRNASGLPDPEQRTTARDMAQLGLRLIRDYPQYYGYFSRRSFAFAGREHDNHNRLLGRYPGMDGLKTGYTRASGFNLAASAERGGRRLVAVVLGGASAGERDGRMASLLDQGFTQLERTRAPLLVAHAAPAPVMRPEVTAASLVDEPEAGPPVPGLILATAQAAEAEEAQTVRLPRRKAAARAKASEKVRQLAALPARQAGKKPGALPYGVQVGAFQKPAQARRAVQQAMRQAPGLLRGTFVSVNGLKQQNRLVYRAMLIGLGKDDADTVCRQLKKQKQGCIVVRAGPLAVAAR